MLAPAARFLALSLLVNGFTTCALENPDERRQELAPDQTLRSPKGTVTDSLAIVEPGPDVPTRVEYLLHFPKEYGVRTERWPLLVFLHGADQRARNIDDLKAEVPVSAAQSPGFPFVLLVPKCNPDTVWSVAALEQLLVHVLKHYEIDDRRVCASGFSMGGYAAWVWATKHPHRFAALVPIGAGGDPEKVKLIKHVPVWAFHGENDFPVPVREAKKMVSNLQNAGGKAQLTVYPGKEHDVTREVFAEQKLFDWLIKQKRIPNP